MHTIDLSTLPEHVGYGNVLSYLDQMDPGEILHLIDDCDPAFLLQTPADEHRAFDQEYSLTQRQWGGCYHAWIIKRSDSVLDSEGTSASSSTT